MEISNLQTEKSQSKQGPDESVLKMISVFLKAVFPMKVLILYLGFNVSEDPSTTNIVLLLCAVIFSFGSLIIYAIKSD